MLTEYRHGALHVVQDTQDKDWIDRRLRAIDLNLFCELQLTLDQEWVWCVVEDTRRETGDRYIVVHEWRDELGRPIPHLADGIVTEMERRRAAGGGRPRTAAESAIAAEKHNAELRARHKADVREAREDLVKEDVKILRRLPAESRPSAIFTGEFDHALRQEEERIEARRRRARGESG